MIQFVTPLPPQASGIAQYSRDLLQAAPSTWPLVVYLEPGGDTRFAGGYPVRPWQAFDPDRPAVLQLGNSAHHRAAFAAALKARGVIVLHDVVLHHALLVEFIRRNDSSGYVRLMRARYGAEGEALAREALRGHVPGDLLTWPLSEPYIERARAVIVHNAFAQARVEALYPDAQVWRVPMGIPLPRLIDQHLARQALSLPHDTFVVASVTHVNPYKRMPVVLRAIRRLAARLPETVLVVAGSVAPDIDLERQIALLGLGPRVRLLGYVDDVTARLVASAADVCINLRYPVTGETSASLLRLLGAARPVIVTDGAAAEDLPNEVGLRIAPDRFEEELLVELMWALATDTELRNTAGAEARAFVEHAHSMQVALDGYRQTIAEAYGLELAAPDPGTIEEEFPSDALLRAGSASPAAPAGVETRTWTDHLADAVAALRLSNHEPTFEQVARNIVELGMDLDDEHFECAAALDEEFLALLACPACRGALRQEAPDALVCEECARRYVVKDGIPDLRPLVE